MMMIIIIGVFHVYIYIYSLYYVSIICIYIHTYNDAVDDVDSINGVSGANDVNVDDADSF